MNGRPHRAVRARAGPARSLPNAPVRSRRPAPATVAIPRDRSLEDRVAHTALDPLRVVRCPSDEGTSRCSPTALRTASRPASQARLRARARDAAHGGQAVRSGPDRCSPGRTVQRLRPAPGPARGPVPFPDVRPTLGRAVQALPTGPGAPAERSPRSAGSRSTGARTGARRRFRVPALPLASAAGWPGAAGPDAGLARTGPSSEGSFRWRRPASRHRPRGPFPGARTSLGHCEPKPPPGRIPPGGPRAIAGPSSARPAVCRRESRAARFPTRSPRRAGSIRHRVGAVAPCSRCRSCGGFGPSEPPTPEPEGPGPGTRSRGSPSRGRLGDRAQGPSQAPAGKRRAA